MALKSGAMFGVPPAAAGPRGGRWLKAIVGGCAVGRARVVMLV
jgi:hypothetical protein